MSWLLHNLHYPLILVQPQTAGQFEHIFVIFSDDALDNSGILFKEKAGDVFQEPQGRTMRVRNLSTTDGVKFIVFQIGDAGKPLMIKAK